ncbi:hypothetical protein BN1708_019707, partial [Verticillium longisporum]
QTPRSSSPATRPSPRSSRPSSSLSPTSVALRRSSLTRHCPSSSSAARRTRLSSRSARPWPSLRSPTPRLRTSRSRSSLLSVSSPRLCLHG